MKEYGVKENFSIFSGRIFPGRRKSGGYGIPKCLVEIGSDRSGSRTHLEEEETVSMESTE